MPPNGAANELQKLLSAHDSLELRGEKVVCTLSGHSMPARAAEVNVYVNGRKYQQLRKNKLERESLKQYEPHIIPSQFVRHAPSAAAPRTASHSPRSGFVFCRVTGRLVPAKEAAILRHSEGKRFRVGLGADRGDGLRSFVR